MVFTAGEIIFKTSIFKEVCVQAETGGGDIRISTRSPRHPLIKHAALLMRKALNCDDSWSIDVADPNPISHIGLGSSSGLIASVACAINELYGCPIDKATMVRYLAQNHGEEIDRSSSHLMPVQCLGGSAAGGLYKGGLIILAGASQVIAYMHLSKKYSIVIGVPSDFAPKDSKTLLEEEEKMFEKIINCSKKYSKEVAYRLVHEVLPAVQTKDLRTIGDLIYDYRFNMGSIDFCSYSYKNLSKLGRKLSVLRTSADVISLSSVGPAFFAITKQPLKCERVFKKNNLNTIRTAVSNESYRIIVKDEI
jgi:predicted sugar kinase